MDGSSPGRRPLPMNHLGFVVTWLAGWVNRHQHVIGLAAREDGAFFDKFVITTDPAFDPTAFGPMGPPEPPRAIESPDPLSLVSKDAMNELPSKLKVLVRNDDEELLILMKLLLEAYGFYPFITADESEALRLLREGGIDLFIQDLLRGPEAMGGWKFFEVIHEDPSTREIPSICMTGSVVSPGFAQRLAERGANGYAGLPIDARHFPAYMRTVIHRLAPTEEEPPPAPERTEDWREEERMIREYLRWVTHQQRAVNVEG